MTYFTFTINSRDYHLPLEDILFIQVSKAKIHRVRVVTDNQEFVTYARISAIEQAYPQFFRCHRDTLVNPEKIRVVDRKHRLLYVGDSNCPVHYARSKATQIRSFVTKK